MRGDRKAPGQDAGVGLEPRVCAETAEARGDSTVRSAFDHPVTTTGLWVEFECCGRNWGTVAWLKATVGLTMRKVCIMMHSLTHGSTYTSRVLRKRSHT
jgi:hypothetical protein